MAEPKRKVARKKTPPPQAPGPVKDLQAGHKFMVAGHEYTIVGPAAGGKWKVRADDGTEADLDPAPLRSLVAKLNLVKSAPEPKPEKEKTIDISGMGSAIAGNMRDMLWERFQRGETTEAGGPSNILLAAAKLKAEGKLNTRDEFNNLIDQYGASLSRKDQEAKIAAAMADEPKPTPSAEESQPPPLTPEQPQQPAPKPKTPRKPRAKKEGPVEGQQGKLKLEDVLKEHASSTPDDGRLKREPIKGVFKGKHFDLSDPVNKFAWEGLGPEHQKMLSRVEQAIAHNEPVYLSYFSKPVRAKGRPNRAGRAEEYQTKERMEQPVGHGFFPIHIGVHFNDKDEPDYGQLHGISASSIVNNGHLLNAVMREHSPYADLGSEKFGQDFAGYIRNLNNGWSGDGRTKIQGTEDYPVNPTEGYTPHVLHPLEADFHNAIIHNNTARFNSTNSDLARRLNQANPGSFLHNGEVNYLRHLVDQEMVRSGQMPEGRSWTHENLEPSIKTFNTHHVGEIHWSPSDMPEAIRPGPGVEHVQRALLKEGAPPKELTGANVKGKVRVKAPGKRVEPPPEPPGPGEVEQAPAAEAQTPAEEPVPTPAEEPAPEQAPTPAPEKPRIRVPLVGRKVEAPAPGPGEVAPVQGPAKVKLSPFERAHWKLQQAMAGPETEAGNLAVRRAQLNAQIAEQRVRQKLYAKMYPPGPGEVVPR